MALPVVDVTELREDAMKLNSISVKLTATMAVFCMLASGISSLIGYNGARKALVESTGARLETILNERTTAIETWLAGLEHDTEALAQSASVVNAVKFFGSAWRAIGEDQSTLLPQAMIDAASFEVPATVEGDAAKGLAAYGSTHDRFHAQFKEILHWYALYDLFLFDLDGNLVYSVAKEPDFAANLVTGQWADSGLGRAFRTALTNPAGQVVFESFSPYGPSNFAPAAFMAVPVVDRTGKTIGVFALQLADSRMTEVANVPLGLGETGEVVIFDEDGHRLTAARAENGAAFWDPVVQTPVVEAARRGEAGFIEDSVGQAGESVMSVFTSLNAYDQTWYAVVEAETTEVLRPVAALLNSLLVKLLITAVVVAGLSYLLSLSVSKPLAGLSRVMRRMSDKDYDQDVPALGRGDEIGAIAKSLDSFRGMLVSGEESAREVAYKSAAFSSSEVPMMIIDRDLVIQYHNDAILRFFNENIETLRDHFPDFDPNTMVGTCIDRFHKKPAHQRQMLADPSRLPLTADIRIGDMMIQLRVYAAHDSDGTYMGNVLEWMDVREVQMNAGILESLRSNQVLAEYDVDGHVADGNDRFHRSFGLSKSDAGKTEFADLFADPAEARAIWDDVKSGGFRAQKSRRKARDGSEVWMDTSISAVNDNMGKVHRVIEIGADVTKAEVAAREASRRREEMEQGQKHVVAELRRGLGALAHGDLTITLDQRFASEYEELRADFNATVTTLMSTLQQLMEVARNIRNGTTEISQAADDLSRRTENQAATLEETAAALEQMTESVRSAAEGASKADTIVKDARENAVASGNVVLEAVEAMNRIESSSKQISQIIGVIDDIAFQTNLLALNAGVEAARAGDAGRGFAVVASEVRALAQRSSDAAKEIKTLISQSSQHVETGVTLVGDAGGALQQIVENVSNISSLVSEIATSSREQSTGLGEINTGVNQLDQVTQQNAAMVEESTAASHSMKQEAENLGSLVAVFTLGEERGGGVTHQAAPPTSQAPTTAAPSNWGSKKAVGSDITNMDWEDF